MLLKSLGFMKSSVSIIIALILCLRSSLDLQLSVLQLNQSVSGASCETSTTVNPLDMDTVKEMQ